MPPPRCFCRLPRCATRSHPPPIAYGLQRGGGSGGGFRNLPRHSPPLVYALPSALCFCRFHALVSSGLLGRAPPFLSGVFARAPPRSRLRPACLRGRSLPPCRPCSRPPVRCLLGSGYGESGVRLRRAFFSAAATIDDDTHRDGAAIDGGSRFELRFFVFSNKNPLTAFGTLFLPIGQKKVFL